MKLSYLNGLRALEACLRCGSFTAAADEIGVTVAAVGQQIRGLEDYLGVRLFDRKPSGVVPTEAALKVASRLTNGFTQIGEAMEELRTDGQTNKLKISLSHYILDDFLARRLPSLHSIAPEVELTYDTREEFVDLHNSDVDMAIRFSPEPGPEFQFVPLFKGCFMPVCTPEFAEKHRLSPDTRDLTGVPLFQLHDVTSDPEWVDWQEILKRHNIKKNDPGPVHMMSGYRVVLSGEGLLLTGLTESFSDLAEGRVIAPLGPNLVTHLSYGYRLGWPAGRRLTRPMKLFHDWLLDECDTYLKEASEILGLELLR